LRCPVTLGTIGAFQTQEHKPLVRRFLDLALTKRGKILAGVGGGVGGVLILSAVLALTGKGPAPLQNLGNIVTGHSHSTPPPTAPLTGLQMHHVPDRPVLAVKVENLPEARPQAGLDKADIVYEEPVEGGITRFIVLFQSHDSSRVGPIRSARLTDAGILKQYGHPIFGYAGGVPSVMHAVDAAGVKDENYDIAVSAYTRDPNRAAPHNLYTSTHALYRAAHEKGGKPAPVFTYDPSVPHPSKKVSFAHLDFSYSSDVYWRWNAKRQVWLRFHGTVPHTLEGGVQVSAKNVVVQMVKIIYPGQKDVLGTPSPEAVSVGTGKAYVFRNGRMVVGKWVRPSTSDVTKFETKSGDVIPLAPGNTWVELFPQNLKVQTGR
jgi:DUF3048 family protein